MPVEPAGTLQLARELIARRSVTPEDGGCQEFLAARLARVGFALEPVRRGEVTNLWARRGDARPLLCFVGHTDVVPTGPLEKWASDPFVPTERAATEWDRGNEYFPSTTWQISNIHGGTGAANVIPGEVEILFNFRFSTASSPEGLKRRVHSILDSHGLDYEIEWSLSGSPYLTPRGTLVETLSAAIHDVTGATPEVSTTGGTSDGRFVAELCAEVVEFGPVNASIHKLNENVDLSAIESLREIYQGLLKRLLAS